MKALELFKKLGYKYFKNSFRITYENHSNNNCKTIEFDLQEQEIYLADDDEEIVTLSKEELQAINIQIKELKWSYKK